MRSSESTTTPIRSLPWLTVGAFLPIGPHGASPPDGQFGEAAVQYLARGGGAVRRRPLLLFGTPQLPGSLGANLSHIEAVIDGLAPHLSRDCLVVGKSTVPVGTAPRPAARLAAQTREGVTAALAWNPEFLREGFAVQDTLRPDRLVVGVSSDQADAALRTLYAPIVQAGTPYITTDLATAELIKVAANAFLATKVSFINAMADVCEAACADVVTLADALGHDTRIGLRFLSAGLGFGGGRLPKDIRAFVARATELERPTRFSSFTKLMRSTPHGGSTPSAWPGTWWFLSRRPAGRCAGGRLQTRHRRRARLARAERRGGRPAEGAAVRVHDPKANDSARQACPGTRLCRPARKGLRGSRPGAASHRVGRVPPARSGHAPRSRAIATVFLDAHNVLPLGQWRAAGWTVQSMGAAPRA